MNFYGLKGNCTHLIEVFGDTVKSSMTATRSNTVEILRSLESTLRAEGYWVSGSVAAGFTATKDGSKIHIEVS